MIDICRHVLSNGLKVVVHRDTSSPLAVVNLQYAVGSRNENPNRTGLAHLMEHLMFTGSKNAPDFDDVVQMAGGENNAFTDEDITNYYMTLPACNVETALWIEADRMHALTLSDESIEVQRKVVIEEFNQRCLNQPYGDLAHLKCALAFKEHPYRWPVIGKEVSHIADASREEILDFYNTHYAPDNAVLVVAGNVDPEQIFAMSEKWFCDINRKATRIPIAAEPAQTAQRFLEVERDVPADTVQMMYHMGSRLSRDYYVMDIATDILADGVSSRLENRFLKREAVVSEVNAAISGNFDPGVITLSATLLPGTSLEYMTNALREEANRLASDGATEYELQKVKNRTEAVKVVSEIQLTNKARNIATYETIGDANLINTEFDIYDSVTNDEIKEAMHRIVCESNESLLYYKAKNRK